MSANRETFGIEGRQCSSGVVRRCLVVNWNCANKHNAEAALEINIESSFVEIARCARAPIQLIATRKYRRVDDDWFTNNRSADSDIDVKREHGWILQDNLGRVVTQLNDFNQTMFCAMFHIISVMIDREVRRKITLWQNYYIESVLLQGYLKVFHGYMYIHLSKLNIYILLIYRDLKIIHDKQYLNIMICI